MSPSSGGARPADRATDAHAEAQADAHAEAQADAHAEAQADAHAGAQAEAQAGAIPPASRRRAGPAGRLWALVGVVEHARLLLVVSLGLAALQAVVLLPVALIVKSIFNDRIPAHDSTGIVVGGCLALGLYAVASVLSVISRTVVVRALRASVVGLRERVADRLYALPAAWFDGQPTGRVQSMVVTDTERVDRMLAQLLTQTGPAVIVGVALCCLAVVLDPLLFAALVVVMPAMFFVHLTIRARLQRRTAAAHDAFADFGADTHDALAAIHAARVHGVSDWERGRRSAPIERVSATSMPLLRLHGVNLAVQGSLAASSGIVVLVVGGLAVADGSLSLGSLIAYYAVVALLLRQIIPVLSGAPVLLAGREALTRIDRFLAEDIGPPYGGRLVLPFAGSLRLDGVSFAYGQTTVLRQVDFTIDAGEHVAIVGPNGAGKSTLLAVLLGILRPAQGTVLADGVPFEQIDLAALRRRIGFVPQEPVLVPGTIAENIAWGRASPAAPAVRAAAHVAAAADFIDRLPDAYETLLGNDGDGLSGGERQRVAIARALVGDPVLLMLDEPTNHLDAASVDAVVDRLRRLPGRPGIVTVTHDPSLAARADRIVRLDAGRVEPPRRTRTVA